MAGASPLPWRRLSPCAISLSPCPTCPQCLCGLQPVGSCRGAGICPVPSHPSCGCSSFIPCHTTPFLPTALSKLLLVHLGVPGAGRGRWVLNRIWREFWRERGGGIVKQSEQIAYPS